VLATPEEERTRWAAATAGELSRTLERLPGVQDARVHIALPEGVRALDDERPLPKASTLLRRRHDAAPVDESQVRALVAGAVQGLTQDRVTIVQVASDVAVIERPTMTSVGPITVTRQSARTLKGVLSLALGLDLVMAVALVVVVRKRHRQAGDSLSNAAG
jgi:type III secretory pathway lipoprotein EscJ